MVENAIQQALAQSFPKSNRENWIQTAMREIDGKDPIENLSWNNADGIAFFPYYTSEDAAPLQFQRNFGGRIAQNKFSASNAWINMPCITIGDEKSANEKALLHLQNGADGVLFDLSKNPDAQPDKLLSGIEWQFCSVSFQGMNSRFLNALSNYISAYYSTPKLEGNFFWETIPAGLVKIPDEIKIFTLIIPPSSPANQVAQALIKGVEAIRTFESYASTQQLFRAIAFSLPLSNDFLQNISSLRALRHLWYQVARAYQFDDFHASDLHIHVRSQIYAHETFQPHGNMLSNVITAMSGVIGTCNSLTVYPEDENNSMLDRIARNVSNILREESHFDKVVDPLCGAFAIEAMTDSIAQHAWKIFQQKTSV
jgi:methylmalonyl-CoA mutase